MRHLGRALGRLRSNPRGLLFVAALLACSAGQSGGTEYGPGVTFPTALGEGSPQAGKTTATPAASVDAPRSSAQGTAGASAGAGAGGDRAVLRGDAPPDPEPLRVAEQFEYEIAWEAGKLRVASVVARRFPQPIVTARTLGRYAIELWIGQELIERVRFDLPLLGAPQPTSARSTAGAAPPSLEAGIHSRGRVLVPAAERARRAVLIDQSTSETLPLAWPPELATAPRQNPGQP